VNDTKAYFSRRGAHLLQYMSVAQYLEQVERYLMEEEARCSCFVGTYTSRRMLVAAQESLIASHCDRLIEEAGNMLTDRPERRHDLRRLYTLISYISGNDNYCGSICGGGPENEAMDKLQNVVRDHIKDVGMEVVKEIQAQGGIEMLDRDESATSSKAKVVQTISSDEIVDSMIRVYEHYKQLVMDSFNDSPGFRTVLDEACKAFVNAVPRAPEWLARYAHCLLDKGFKESKVEEEARCDALDRVGFLFAYITDKDIFHKFYAKLLSKRIIQLTSMSDEDEERMLANLRKISGFEFTSKLQRMFVDKALSRELHTGYVQWQERLAARHHAGVLQSDSRGQGSVFTFTDDEENASRMMEEMTVGLNVVPSSGAAGPDSLTSPPLSPMYFSPKGLSPRMNILPSFAWGKTVLKHLRKNPSSMGASGGVAPRDSSSLHAREDDASLLFPGSGGYGGVARRTTPPTFEAFTFVLTAGCWPLQSVSSTFTPPGPIEDYVKSFLEFYNEAHSGRKLEWLYHLGHGELVVHGLDRQYRIYSSTFQMGILHQFNASESLTVANVAKGITISEQELSRHLFPLVKAGLLVLQTDKPVFSCDDIESEHIVFVNRKFSSRRTRIKINIVDHSRQPQKEDLAPVEVIQDRKMSVQAAICRIMKARKELDHKTLVKEAKEQLQHLFVPEGSFIKQCIEELISKDYLARKAGAEAYTYCA
jgi:DNA-binding transcriptional ArsR family regulator